MLSPQILCSQEFEEGAGNRIRTDDLLITNQLLYQLSYAGEGRWFWEGKVGEGRWARLKFWVVKIGLSGSLIDELSGGKVF